MFLLIFSNTLFGQDFICGMPEAGGEESFQKSVVPGQTIASCPPAVEWGYYLPSKDTLRARVIFAKFQDDTDNVSYWAQDSFPTFALQYLDADASVGSTHKHSLTNYYRTFSNEQFILIGEVDTVTLNQSMFHSDFVGTTTFDYVVKTYNANREVLTLLSDRPNFELHDDWARAQENHIKCADGKADMIIMIWRSNRFDKDNRYGGFASIGAGSNYTINDVDVISGFSSTGSGVSMIKQGGYDSTDQLFDVVVHELGHYFLGGNHPHIQSDLLGTLHWGSHRFPSMLASSGGHHTTATIPNPFESDYLGWITPVVLTTGTDVTATLGDYFATHEAVKWSRTGSNDLLYFFNSQKTSLYDNITPNTDDKGIFVIYHRFTSRSGYMSESYNNKLISSEGDYDWVHTNPYYTAMPDFSSIFRRAKPNPVYGRSHLTMLYRQDLCAGTNAVEWIWNIARTDSTVTPPSHTCKDISMPAYASVADYNYLGHGFISSFSYENNRAYFSEITNPMAKRYQVWDATTATALPISMHVAPTNTNGSIDVTFRFDEDPYTIDSDRVWSGEITISDGQLVVIKDGATLTILPGTRVFFGKNNARISVSSLTSGKIIAIGEPDNPITFTTSYPTESWDHANEWGQLWLGGAGSNRFEWCIFEYGNKHIEIASRDNEIKHSIFRNGWRGISSYSNQWSSGGTNSEVRLEEVLLTNNRTVGFVGYINDSHISYITINHNGQAGAWYSSANGHQFHHSRADSNAAVSGSRSGIESMSGSTVFLMRYVSGSYQPGYNSIRNQPQFQVYRASGSTGLVMGDYYNHSQSGKNNVTRISSDYLVRNYASSQIMAHENWWSSSSPDPSDFYGPIDFDYNLTTPVTVYGASVLPVESHLYRDQYLKLMPGSGPSLADESDTAITFRQEVRQRAAELRERLDSDVREEDLSEFAWLFSLMWDPNWYNEDITLNRQTLSGLFESIRTRSSLSPAECHLIALYLKDRYDQAPSNAARVAENLLDSATDARVRLPATHLLMVHAEQRGDVDEAFTRLDELISLERDLGVPEDAIRSTREMFESIFLNRPVDAVPFRDDTSERHLPEPRVPESERLQVNVYPNPFNPSAVISLRLMEESRVRIEVFDMIGRRVAVLANGSFTPGVHTFKLDGRTFASGIYIIRTDAGNKISTHRVTLLK